MLVLVSFVLVLAAAVTLVVGLLQSGLTLIYLSIGCSVLAGVVLAVAVLRGRPEPKSVSTGRAYTPPPAQVPASVGASGSGSDATTSWSTTAAPTADPYPSTAAPAPAADPYPSAPAAYSPPPAPYTPPPAGGGEDVATKAAGAALLGRLRGKRGDKGAEPVPAAVEEPAAYAAGAAPVASVASDATTEMAAVADDDEDDDGFPIADYDRLRATELLSRLPALDRSQLEAVRDREAGGKNRFTIMSRVDALLATAEEPAWEVDGDEWEDEPEVLVADAGAFDDDQDDEEFEEERVTGAVFPIPAYETLTVGQILPRLSDLDADELAQIRTREEMGRGRGTILDRIDRLASRRSPARLAMPPAPPAPPVRTAPARKAPIRKATAAVPEIAAPAVRKAPGRKAAAAVIVVPPVTKAAAPRRAVAKTVAPRPAAKKAAPVAAVVVPRKARAPKAVAPVIPAAPTAVPMKEAVKKARAAKSAKKL